MTIAERGYCNGRLKATNVHLRNAAPSRSALCLSTLVSKGTLYSMAGTIEL